MEHMEFDRLLSAVFRGGELKNRELRLSDEEVRLLADHYPARVEALGEQWYQVSFTGESRIEV